MGSAQLITDYTGAEYERLEYTPYGELWIEKTSGASALDIPYRFTGKERDEETGLYYYGARYLDAKTSRWLGVDPAMHQGDYIPSAPVNEDARERNGNLPNGGMYNHINMHVYHYSNNNPIKYTDPDGRVPFMAITGIIGAVTGAGISIGADIVAGNDINWRRAGLAAGAGLIVGLTLGAAAATTATATAVTTGNAAASFSTVTGYGTATTATTATTITANQTIQRTIPQIANRGHSVGRVVPNNLNEQIAMKQIQLNPLVGAEKLPINIRDNRWNASEGWVKMQNIVTLSDGTKINIHFVYNEMLNLVDDFKFK